MQVIMWSSNSSQETTEKKYIIKPAGLFINLNFTFFWNVCPNISNRTCSAFI